MILPIPLLAVVFLSLVPYVSCQNLMDALATIPDCTEYRKFLQEYPAAQSPPPGPNFEVYCPNNAAVVRMLAGPAGRMVRRDKDAATLRMAAQTATGPASVTRPTMLRTKTTSATPSPSVNQNSTAGAPGKRQVTNVITSLITVVSSTTSGATSATAGSSPGGSLTAPTAVATGFRTSGPDPFAVDPNQVTLKTTFDNPAIVNLGPGAFLPMVSFSTVPGSLGLACGLGDVVNVNPGSGVPFDRGTIYVAQDFVTLPETLSQSLTILGQNLFLAALRKFNLLSIYETTPLVTAFVPIDSSLSGDLSECACKQHIIKGQPPLYTPDIELGRAYATEGGGTITIEIENGVYTLSGGATIVKSNIITKNGVVHLINGTTPGICGPGAFTGGSNRVGPWAGGLVGLVGVVVGLLA